MSEIESDKDAEPVCFDISSLHFFNSSLAFFRNALLGRDFDALKSLVLRLSGSSAMPN